MGALEKLKNLFGNYMKTNEADNLDNHPDNNFLDIFSDTTQKRNVVKPRQKNRNKVTLIEQEEKILEELANSSTNPQLQAMAKAIFNCNNVLNLLDTQGNPIDFKDPLIAQIMSQKFEFAPSFNSFNIQPPEILEKDDETEKDKKNQKNSLTLPDPIPSATDKTSYSVNQDLNLFLENRIEHQLKTIINELNNQRPPTEVKLLKQTLASLMILKPKFSLKNSLVDDEKNLLTNQRTKFLQLPKLKPLFSKAKKRNNQDVLNSIEGNWLSVIPTTETDLSSSLNNAPETTSFVNNTSSNLNPNDLSQNKTSKQLWSPPKLKPPGFQQQK